MAPIIATRVASSLHPSELDPFLRLQPTEREFVGGLKRKDRQDIARLLMPSKTVRRESPLRIQVLQSRLPEHLRMQIFDDLGRQPCEKYNMWVRRLLRVPLHVHHPSAYANLTLQQTLARARHRMDEHITGHDEAKREILQLVCQAKRADGVCESNYSLGFEGPPGTGKTHFVKTALAHALDRPLVSIPLGGANDIAYLLGNIYVYEGSKEGCLAGALMEAKCCNPIIYFDEVDKVSASERGAEIIGVLIHLIDPTANMALRDRYFHGVDLDFSRCTFVFSYNDPSRVSPILLDRIKRISMPPPSEEERKRIVVEHLVPRVQARLRTTLSLDAAAVNVIVQRACLEQGGMRSAEKDVDHVIASALLHQASSGDAVPASGTGTGMAVCDENDAVVGSFASHALAVHTCSSHVPPPGMYT